MIGFLVTMENIYRNEHVTPVFKIIISNPNYWNLSGWLCKHMDLSAIDRKGNSRDVAKSPCKISWMECTAKYFCSSIINVTCK